MVRAEGQRHHVTGPEGAVVADHGPALERADGEDRRLRLVDHRGEARDAEHAEVGHREGAAAQVVGRQLAVARGLGEAPGVGRDGADRLDVRVEDDRDQKGALGRDGDPDVDPAVALGGPVPERAVDARVLAQGLRARLDDEVVVRGHGAVGQLGLQARAQLHERVGGDVDLDGEVGDRLPRLGHAAGDHLLDAGELLGLDRTRGHRSGQLRGRVPARAPARLPAPAPRPPRPRRRA